MIDRMPPPPVWQSPLTIPRTKRIADAIDEVGELGELGVRSGFSLLFGSTRIGNRLLRNL